LFFEYYVKVLQETILEKAKLLTYSERCSLFVLSTDKRILRTTMHSGLQKEINIPINNGIAGKTATSGKIFNITDAYDCSDFDSRIDEATGS
jgi:signal transduction protein with GAF and PtsI domain